ncbi:hypothetical protein HYPSUDRAFT_217869 [Hypholoma sublateritium FD-334 SS-4]|uniref:F-box domain-containing protein n=1 Tax=Hypholoma sublateritium (strain FD-334 SS-4) TaxID=945553 RepID=A0A0D2PFY2_HYPSF|nr:hypothetical protein HYPSUDRAFT_217869 [Hypholoma sublateritium FD-334 SS-4]
MDYVALPTGDSVLEVLLKTNRPPTEQETATVLESILPINAKLEVVEARISDAIAHIEALKSQVEQAEIKLQHLRDEEAAILETLANHHRVFSSFRNLPEDVLREICVTYVEADMPTLSYRGIIPSPYILAQICSEMRHIALTTPVIWASMRVEIRSFEYDRHGFAQRVYSIMARRASEWFERAGGLALTVSIEDTSDSDIMASVQSSVPDPSNILFDTLLSYSTRWKEIQFDSFGDVISTPMIRIAALTADDLPLLQSVSIHLEGRIYDPRFCDSVFLTIPTLKHLMLETDGDQTLTVNWSVLTSVTLRGNTDCYGYSKRELARFLQQTKCLVSCDIHVDPLTASSEEHHSDKINLPFLKTLLVHEGKFATATSRAPSILDRITAPNLEVFHICDMFLDLSLADFFKRSPHIQKLSLPYLNKDQTLTGMMGLLRHCPSLTALSLHHCQWDTTGREPSNRDANSFLRAFVEEGDIGVICPCLQYFCFRGKCQFSLETLRLFLEGKQGEFAALNALLPWKRVDISIKGIKDEEIRQQILDLVSQKRAAGLDIDAFIEGESRRRDHHLYL